MNRSILETELKRVGISLSGWLPVLQCAACKHRWEPFYAVAGASAPTARLDYWKCPNQCNAKASVPQEIQAALPQYVMLNDIPGMVFGDDDLQEFERYVRSMDATVVPNRAD
jgi:hypothetical protein